METPSIPQVTPDELAMLRAAVAASLPAYLEDLERLVNIDCGSYTKAGVDEVGRWTSARLRELGGDVVTHPNDAGLGDTVIAVIPGDDPDGPTLLCIAHLDTVFDPGTAAARPFHIRDGVATGPGVTDMKSGLLAGLHAIAALREATGGLPLSRLVFVANPDEEIGSPVSTAHIRRIAQDVDACLVLECARANGDIVSSRKGNLGLTVTVTGRAAHAGIEPEKGRSAILEAARITTDLQALNGRWPGVTINVGVISGGTRPNVVPERCSLEVDVRAVTRNALVEVEAAIRSAVEPRVVPDVSVTVDEVGRHWPMEKLETIRAPGRARLGAGRGARVRRPRRCDRGCIGREHDGRHGCADARRAGTDRRAGPCPGRVPRGRVDRAPDDAPGRADRRDRPRPGGPCVASGAHRPGGGDGGEAGLTARHG